jgi:hypothetical protein
MTLYEQILLIHITRILNSPEYKDIMHAPYEDAGGLAVSFTQRTMSGLYLGDGGNGHTN